MELLQDSDSSSETIGPHWPSSYPEFLSPNQSKSEQQRIVWARLAGQRLKLAKSLKEQKERYEALRRELNPRTTQVESSHDPLYRDIAIAECLKHWRPYLAGSPHEIIVHTDHANLTYWRQPQKISRHIARQVLELEEYNIKLQHVLGKNNGRADTLSRRPDYDQGTTDNKNVTILPDRLFI